MKIHGWKGPDAATKPLVSPRLPRHKEWTEKAEKERNPPASTDIWLLRGNSQGTKEPHAFAFSPPSKPQQAGLLTCCLARTKLHAYTPHASPNIFLHLFSIRPLLQQYSGSPPRTPYWPDSVLSSNDWSGYLIPLITCQYWPHCVASTSFQHSSYRN